MVSQSPEHSASGFLLEMWNIIVGREAGSYGVVFGRFRCRFVHFIGGFIHPECPVLHLVQESSAFRRGTCAFRLGICTVRLEVGVEAQM